jgi:hypothetical protein
MPDSFYFKLEHGVADYENMATVKDAKMLCDSLTDEFDFDLFLMDHPNAEKAINRLEMDMGIICPGCQRELSEPHKMCPAWGTSYYMSGKLFTPEIEEATKEERQKARDAANKRYQEMWDNGIDPSGLS